MGISVVVKRHGDELREYLLGCHCIYLPDVCEINPKDMNDMMPVVCELFLFRGFTSANELIVEFPIRNAIVPNGASLTKYRWPTSCNYATIGDHAARAVIWALC